MKKSLFITLLIFAFFPAMAQEVPDSLKIVQDGWNYYQNDYRVSRRDIVRITSSNLLARKYIERAGIYNTINWLTSFVGGGLIGYPLGVYLANGKPDWNLAYAGLGVLVLSIPLEILNNRAKNKAISIYNQGLQPPPTTKLNFKVGLTGNGFGLAMRF